MKKLAFVTFAILVIGGLSLTLAHAQPIALKTPSQGNIQKLIDQQFVADFSKKLDAQLKNKSVGYAYFITSKNTIGIGGAGGDARRAPDPNPRKMSFDDKINIASVSKTITAAALLKLMNAQGISIDSPAFQHLPQDWTFGPNFKAITFKQLLTHRAGIRCETEVTYTNLKNCVAGGVKLSDKGIEKYNNSNFALFRIVIPILNGFKSAKLANNAIGDSIASGAYATQYMDYVRKNILAPAGISGIDCKPIPSNPALSYQFPSPVAAGDSFGDMTETNASRGWNLSAKQLSTFMFNLLQTEKVVPAAVSKLMKDNLLGLWKDTTTIPGMTSYEHGGFYPGKQNKGELNSLIINFSNGVNVAVIVNSQFGPGQSIPGAVKLAMKAAMN